MRAVVLKEFGPPENLKWETVPTPEPQPDEVLLRVGAVSVDLFQMEFRSGRALPQVKLPRADLGADLFRMAWVGHRPIVLRAA